jgi:hypothetical protein
MLETRESGERFGDEMKCIGITGFEKNALGGLFT